MKIEIDTDARTFTQFVDGVETQFPLYSKPAFEALSLEWVKVGWALKYYHNFNWFGLPVLQLPEDMIRIQEVIWRVRPTVIIETGVFKGGSLIYSATLLEAMHQGRVIGIDIEVPAYVREAVEQHPLAHRITLLEGDSAGDGVVSRVQSMIRPDDIVLVILDSCHTRAHVARELERYAPLVSAGSYIVATDGIMSELTDVPGGLPEWAEDNPSAAAAAFAAEHPEFHLEQPEWISRDGDLTENVTYWPGAWLRRI